MAEYLQYDWGNHKISRDLLQDIHYRKTEPKDKTISLEALQSLIHQSQDPHFKNTVQQDDATLFKFLYARKFNVPEAFQLLENYYRYRRKNQELFKHFTIDAVDIQTSLENTLPGVLSSRDRKGRCVLIMFANNWDCTYSLLSIYRSLLYSLEYLSNEISNQANGFVMIVDWTEFSFKQSLNLKPSVLKLMIEGLQDCFPARFKGVHFIGQPWYVEAALTIIKPFLHDKTKDRIFVHGNNMSTLHDHVHKDILPAELGGEQPSYNSQIWLDKLISSKPPQFILS